MHTPEIIEDILAQSGVKGMRWGVRRKATVGAQEVVISDKRIGKGIKTSGGKGHPAHSEATSVRVSSQIAKKSGIKALSDAQLKAYNNRLNLEQNTKRLMYEDSSPPSKFIKNILGQTGRKTSEELSSETMKQGKRALRAAAALA